MIDVEGLHWTFEQAGEPSLRGVDLHIEAGEMIVLCGASGSGKSTLLRACNGLIPHLTSGRYAGTVAVASLTVESCRLDQIGRRTGTVLQHPRRQFFADRVRDELVFAAENFGLPPALIAERLDAVVADLGLSPILDTRMTALSAGQQQRIAIASALVHSPDVLLLDEPTSNLSTAAVAEVMSALAAVKAHGTTIVIAEHRLHAVASLADRVVVLADGAIQYVATAADFTALGDQTLRGLGLRPLRANPVAPAPARATGPTIASRNIAAEAACGDARTALTVDGLRWSAGGRTVLDIESAVFPRGAVTAILGENGAGKTSFTRILAGLERHDGTVALDGTPMSRRQRRRNTAMVLQDVGRQLFFPSVADELTAARPGADDVEIGRVLTDFGLSGTAERHPLSLSGGQQQRLAVAAAGLLEREVMIFDEPSSGVDRRNIDALAGTIRQAAARGCVVILVTHDDEFLTRTADLALELTPFAGSASSPPRQTRELSSGSRNGT